MCETSEGAAECEECELGRSASTRQVGSVSRAGSDGQAQWEGQEESAIKRSRAWGGQGGQASREIRLSSVVESRGGQGEQEGE